MFLSLNDEHKALRDMAREVLRDLDPIARIRQSWPSSPRSEQSWTLLAQTGLIGIGTPEVGGDEVDSAIVSEQAGYAVVDEPLVEQLAIVIPILRAFGSGEQRRWLDRVAAGEVRIGVALGAEPWLVDVDSLNAVVVEQEGQLHLLPMEAVDAVAIDTHHPSHPISRVQAVTVTAESHLPAAEPMEAWMRGALGAAATLVGLAQRLLDVAVEHASSREQFGRAIGSFQAVQHQLADVVTLVEPARASVWYAAVLLRDGDPDAARAVATAKVAANEAAALADRVALQVLAGIGFTWEHDLHFMLKAAARWRSAYGDSYHHRRALAGSGSRAHRQGRTSA